MKKWNREALLRTSVLAGFVAAGAAAAPAIAQEEGAAQRETIQVTGSRIARPDATAPSPIVSVDAPALEVNNTINIEDYLNDLPQLIPGFDATSNNPGNGTANLSLRGLGAGRTLVLLDGRRMVSEGAGQTVNINTVPAALIERVDVVTGGASAVYGSDAVAGVVNFILRTDFEGVELDTSHRWSEQGGGSNTSISATIGGNFADGRGNAVLNMSYNRREELFQGDREFSRNTLIDNGSGTFGTTGSVLIEETLFAPGGVLIGGPFANFDWAAAGLQDRFDDRCVGTPDTCWAFAARIDANGLAQPFRTSGPNNDRYNYAPDNYLQLPQERYNFAAFANYEINRHFEVYGRAMYSNVIVDSQLAPTPAALRFTVSEDNAIFDGHADVLELMRTNPAINLGDTNGDGLEEFQFDIGRRFTEFGPRNSLRDTHAMLVGGGVRGDLFLSGWTYDVYAHFARTRADQIQTGNLSVSAFTAEVEAGRALIFGGPGALTDNVVAAATRTGAIFETNEQVQFVATTQGEIEQFRFGTANTPLQVVLGVEYREEFSRRQPDSVLGPDVRGFNQSTFIEGRFDVYEFFAEGVLPVIEGGTFAEYLGLNAAYRRSNYTTVGNTDTFAIGAEWIPVSDVRFRAQFQRAVRAPSVSQLFQTDTNGFPGVSDPCASGLGAWGNLSSAQQATVEANCVANGVPMGAVPVAQVNSQVETIFRGARDLEAEEADTITLGVSYSPSFLPGLTVRADYYDIEIGNALSGPSAQEVVNACTLFGVQAACDLLVRGGGGTLTLIDFLSTENQTGLFVRGIDYGFDYIFDAGDMGTFALGLNATWTDTSSFQLSPQTTRIECAGFYGADCGQPTPVHKWLASASWMYGPLTANVRWTHVGEVTDTLTQFYGARADQLDVTHIGSIDYFDLNLSYDFTDNVRFYGGVRNMFDQSPPIVGDGPQSQQANTWPATYDPFGRQFFLGVTARY